MFPGGRTTNLRLRINLGVGSQSAYEKFLKKIRNPRAGDGKGRIFESQPRSITVARRIVKVGDAPSGEASQDA
jgi:hypothetical protein